MLGKVSQRQFVAALIDLLQELLRLLHLSIVNGSPMDPACKLVGTTTTFSCSMVSRHGPTLCPCEGALGGQGGI